MGFAGRIGVCHLLLEERCVAVAVRSSCEGVGEIGKRKAGKGLEGDFPKSKLE